LPSSATLIIGWCNEFEELTLVGYEQPAPAILDDTLDFGVTNLIFGSVPYDLIVDDFDQFVLDSEPETPVGIGECRHLDLCLMGRDDVESQVAVLSKSAAIKPAISRTPGIVLRIK
jgi:hypothetical protein